MKSYRTYVTVDDPGELVLKNLPFTAGQQVEVIVKPRPKDRAESIEHLKKLFKSTQQLPQARTVTEEEIAAEVAAYRGD